MSYHSPRTDGRATAIDIDMTQIATAMLNIKASFAGIAASFDRGLAPFALYMTEMQLRQARRVRNGARRHGLVKHARDARRHAAKRVARHLP